MQRPIMHCPIMHVHIRSPSPRSNATEQKGGFLKTAASGLLQTMASWHYSRPSFGVKYGRISLRCRCKARMHRMIVIEGVD